MDYLGARENGPPVQNQEAITPAAWHGIVGLIQSALRTALLAHNFPDRSCIDRGVSEAITGCNERQFYLRLNGDHPEIPVRLDADTLLDTVSALEAVEFCSQHVSRPTGFEPHTYFAHELASVFLNNASTPASVEVSNDAQSRITHYKRAPLWSRFER